MENKILILCGKSASGKDTIMKQLVKDYNYTPIVSYTTRPMRPNETNGVEYNFVSRDKFIDMIENNELVEYRKYNTLLNGEPDIWYYGVKKLVLDNDNNKYVIILDLKGAKEFIDYYGRENIECVYISCNDKIRTQRAMDRDGFDKREWERRLERDREDFRLEKRMGIVDREVRNEGERMGEVVSEIVGEVRGR